MLTVCFRECGILIGRRDLHRPDSDRPIPEDTKAEHQGKPCMLILQWKQKHAFVTRDTLTLQGQADKTDAQSLEVQVNSALGRGSGATSGRADCN